MSSSYRDGKTCGSECFRLGVIEIEGTPVIFGAWVGFCTGSNPKLGGFPLLSDLKRLRPRSSSAGYFFFKVLGFS